MHAASERQPPLARVLLLRLPPEAAVLPTHDTRDLTQILGGAGGRTLWTPVVAAVAPAVDVLELHPGVHWDDALGLLDAAESERAFRLRDAGGRQAYVYAHAALRVLLARELGTGPRAIAFSTGPFGKPRLSEPGALIHFSISRRPGFVAIALGNAPLGVDVEVVRGGIDIAGISQRFFTQAEQSVIAGEAVGNDRVSRFFSLWSRKEALVKAAGVGVDALGAAEALKSLAALADEHGVRRAYCLHQLPSAADHVLAMAIESPSQTFAVPPHTDSSPWPHRTIK